MLILASAIEVGTQLITVAGEACFFLSKGHRSAS